MQETTKIKLKRNLEIGMKVSFAIGLVFSAIGFNYSDMVLLLYIGLSALVIGNILGLIYFLRPRTEDEQEKQEKACNSTVVKYMLYLLKAVMVIVLIYGVVSFHKELISAII